MPLFRKRKTIWQIRELEGYLNKVPESSTIPNYDANALNELHQSIDAFIKNNWEFLHPAEQDFIYSWFIEYKTAEDQNKNMQLKLENVNKEIAATQQNTEANIEKFNTEIKMLNSEILNAKNALIQNNQLIEEITNAIQNQQIGAEQLKENLGHRIKDLNQQMIQQQKQFEINQTKIGSQFKTKVMELDEEKLLLNEAITQNTQKIQELEKENDELKKMNRLIKTFQDKIKILKKFIGEIPSNILEGGA
ncbi:MAG TPA: hypothetical protein VMV49_10375 [Candidatus Deferrimicrobium sp.]|nr:hypothetical protein [Candidatus Deferrimicrobium sp.]